MPRASPNRTEIAIMTNLANKTALITGASRGMGRATALALAAAGARVIVHYGRNADEAEGVVDQIRAAGAPGVIDTDMSNFTQTEDGRKTVMSMQALKRIGRPGDVASVIAFLVSDAARWITGDSIAVDGVSKLWSGRSSVPSHFLARA